MRASASRRSLFAMLLIADWLPTEAPLPRYDYRCPDDACDTDTFEVSKSYTDNSVTECPVCGSTAKKLLSPIAVHFKGSGFYVTDNRASNGASGGDSDKSESKSDAKSESKSGSDSGSKSGSKSGSDSKTESKTATSSKSSDSKSSSTKSASGSTSGATSSKK